MRSTAPASPSERRLRARLVEHCLVRRLAFKVAKRTDNRWCGVAFSIKPGNLASVFHVAETRAVLLRELLTLVDCEWPLHRGAIAPHANRAAKKARIADEQARAVAS